jgi:hypothetical protein
MLLKEFLVLELARVRIQGVFSVMLISSRTRDWPACVKFHAADDTQFRVPVFYGLRDSIDNR